MFCPRCGRPVSDSANFCGGCGLPRAEIIKQLNRHREAMKTPEIPPVEDLSSRADQIATNLQDEITAPEHYTTEGQENTNDFTLREEKTDFSAVLEDARPEGSADAEEEAPVYTAPEKPEETVSKAREEPKAAKENVYKAAEEAKQAEPKQTVYKAPEYRDYVPGGESAPDEGEEFYFSEEDAPLTTADFLLMMVIASIPVVGLFYIVDQAISGKNRTKRSYARAFLIFSVYAFVLVIAFMVGIIARLY